MSRKKKGRDTLKGKRTDDDVKYRKRLTGRVLSVQRDPDNENHEMMVCAVGPLECTIELFYAGTEYHFRAGDKFTIDLTSDGMAVDLATPRLSDKKIILPGDTNYG